MFELPEFTTLARQINETLSGKTARYGELGNSPHKFVWYNTSREDFERLVQGKTLGVAYARGKWLFIPLEPGYELLFGECGGKILYHPPGSLRPPKYHLLVEFTDGSFLTATTQMWGAMELHPQDKVLDRQYIKDMRPTPVDEAFSFDYFHGLLSDPEVSLKRSLKGLLTQEQIIPGLGNAIAQDILFQARLRPTHPLAELSPEEQRNLYGAIVATVQTVIEQGGRDDEVDLFNHPGGYVRLMDNNCAGKPCPRCGETVEKLQYLGGACYFCPGCQE